MFWFARRQLRFVIDCADARRLRALCDGPRPRGVRVRPCAATRLDAGTVTRVMRVEVRAACSCPPHELGAWLGGCFAGCEELWYVDGIPARGGARPHALELRRLIGLFAP